MGLWGVKEHILDFVPIGEKNAECSNNDGNDARKL